MDERPFFEGKRHPAGLFRPVRVAEDLGEARRVVEYVRAKLSVLSMRLRSGEGVGPGELEEVASLAGEVDALLDLVGLRMPESYYPEVGQDMADEARTAYRAALKRHAAPFVIATPEQKRAAYEATLPKEYRFVIEPWI